MVENVLCRGARALGELRVAVEREQVLPVLEQGGERVQALRDGLGGLRLCRRHRGGSRCVLVVGGVVQVEATSEF